MKIVPVTRLFTLAMAAVLTFGVLIPIAVKEHRTWLAFTLGAVFVVYCAANVVLWMRLHRRV